MSRPIAFTIVWFSAVLGLVLGLAFCMGIGHYLGLLFNNSTAGELTGLAWFVFGYITTMDDMADDLETRVDLLSNFS